MKEIIDKLSSYNIFNYLLPGVLFVAIAKHFTEYNLILDHDFIGAFFYYFIGMVISRFGSLIIEPMLKKIMFVKFSDYSDFISASKILFVCFAVVNVYHGYVSSPTWTLIHFSTFFEFGSLF
jgi:hypothetical protein